MKVPIYTDAPLPPGASLELRWTAPKDLVVVAIEPDPYGATEVQGGRIGATDLDRCRFAIIRDRPRLAAFETPIEIKAGAVIVLRAKNVLAEPDHVGATFVATTPEDFATLRSHL